MIQKNGERYNYLVHPHSVTCILNPITVSTKGGATIDAGVGGTCPPDLFSNCSFFSV